jgi:hypothetical protein
LGAESANGVDLLVPAAYSTLAGRPARTSPVQLQVADRLGMIPICVRQVKRVPKPSGDEQHVRAPLGHYLVVGD